MGDVLFVGTAVSNMFGARMRTTLAQRLVSIDTASSLRTSLFSVLKMANEALGRFPFDQKSREFKRIQFENSISFNIYGRETAKFPTYENQAV